MYSIFGQPKCPINGHLIIKHIKWIPLSEYGIDNKNEGYVRIGICACESPIISFIGDFIDIKFENNRIKREWE